MTLASLCARAQEAVAPSVCFLLGDSSKGYGNTVFIEVQRYQTLLAHRDASLPEWR